MKKIVQMFLIVAVGIVIGTIVMCGIYCIPVEDSFDHAKESKSMYSEEIINYWADKKAYALISNFTDAIMINTALFRPYGSVAENALLNPYLRYNGESPQDSLCRLLESDNNTNIPEKAFVINYGRYWHGYLLYIAPALHFFNIGEMKTIMMFFQFLLVAIVLYMIGKQKSFLNVFFFSLVILFINPITTVMTFQEADIFVIMLIISGVILGCNDSLRKQGLYPMLFCVDGILVAFFDFLTYPLVAWGIPLLIVFELNEYGLLDGMITLVKNSVSWGIGYLGMWSGKWIVASLFTGDNIVADGIASVLYRTQGDPTLTEHAESGSYLYALKIIWWSVRNLEYFVLLCMVVLAVLFLLLKGYRIRASWTKVSHLIPVAIIGISPFIWFFVAKNHTIVHPHLEFRNLAITIGAGLVMLLKTVEVGKKKASNSG